MKTIPPTDLVSLADLELLGQTTSKRRKEELKVERGSVQTIVNCTQTSWKE